MWINWIHRQMARLDIQINGIFQGSTHGVQVSLNLEGRKRDVPLSHNYFETKKDKLKQGKEYVY